MGILAAILKTLKFPLKLLTGLLRKKRLKRTEREQNQIKHVWNFDPTRLKNRTWQIRSGKKTNKKPKKYKKKAKK